MRYQRFIFLLSFTLFLSNHIVAQWASPMRWGKIKSEEQITDAFPEAGVLILSDFGHNMVGVDLEGQYQYVFTHHRRILVREASDFEPGILELYTEPLLEKLRKVQVQLILPSGKVRKLKKNVIHSKKVDENWLLTTFLLPTIPNGAVIEYRYEIHSSAIERLRNWYFQLELPVVRSEVRLTTDYDLTYRIALRRALNITQPDNMDQLVAEQRQDLSGFRRMFVMQNQTPVTTAPFQTTMEDYRAHLEFYLERIRMYGQKDEVIFSDWNSTAQQLLADELFGQQFLDSSSHFLWLEAGSKSEVNYRSEWEKMRQLYQFVNESLEWDGTFSFWSKGDLNELIEIKKANSGEYNLILLCLLRKAGFEVHPVLISTRSNGKLNFDLPLYTQFNHVILAAKIEDQLLFLDAGDLLRPPGMVREEALNRHGWLIGDKENRAIEIDGAASVSTLQATLTLDSLGRLNGKLQSRQQGYNALWSKKAFLQLSPEVYWEEELGWINPRIEIHDVQVESWEAPDLALENHISCTIYDAATPMDGKLLLYPVIYSQFKENPFEETVRLSPVDFSYPISEYFVLNLTLPPNYRMISKPEDCHYKLEEEGASFQMVSSQRGSIIQIVSKLDIKHTLYGIDKYPIVQQFFSLVSEKMNEGLILQPE